MLFELDFPLLDLCGAAQFALSGGRGDAGFSRLASFLSLAQCNNARRLLLRARHRTLDRLVDLHRALVAFLRRPR